MGYDAVTAQAEMKAMREQIMYLEATLNDQRAYRREHWRYTFAAAALNGTLASDVKLSLGTADAAMYSQEHADALLLRLESNPLPERAP